MERLPKSRSRRVLGSEGIKLSDHVSKLQKRQITCGGYSLSCSELIPVIMSMSKVEENVLSLNIPDVPRSPDAEVAGPMS